MTRLPYLRGSLESELGRLGAIGGGLTVLATAAGLVGWLFAQPILRGWERLTRKHYRPPDLVDTVGICAAGGAFAAVLLWAIE